MDYCFTFTAEPEATAHHSGQRHFCPLSPSFLRIQRVVTWQYGRKNLGERGDFQHVANCGAPSSGLAATFSPRGEGANSRHFFITIRESRSA
jgi:hypothetical protein